MYYGFSVADLNSGSSPNRGLGSVADAFPDAHLDVIAGAGFAQDVWTGVVSSTGPTDLDYTGPDSVAQTYTLVASATAAGVLTEISAVEDADDTGLLTFLGDYNVTASSLTLVATAKDPSVVGTLVSSTALAWTHTTTGAEGSDLPLARAVLLAGTGSGVAGLGVPKAGLMSEIGDQLITLSPVYGASSFYSIVVILKNWRNGEDEYVSVGKVAAASDTATDCTAIAAAINAALPANTFLASGVSGTTVTLTAEVSGLVGEVIATISGGAGTIAVAYTNGAPGNEDYDADAALLGVVEQSTSVVLVSGSPVVEKRTVAPVLRGPGSILVDPTDTPTDGASVWIGTGSSNAGKFAAAAAADYAPISRSKMRWGVAEGNYHRLHILSRLK
jgi:hypothetical protein